MKMSQKISSCFVLDNARRWIKGTIIQGESILSWETKMSAYMCRLFEEPRTKGNQIKDMIFFHQQYFISSLNQAREWIRESIKYDSRIKEIYRKINEKFPDIRDVRNMNEHDIDYFKEKGNNQKRFLKSFDGGIKIVSDATSTIITGDGYFIGGRINLQEVLDYFREIYPIIESVLEQELEKEKDEDGF